MADTISKTQTGAIITTTSSHNVADDVTYNLRNMTGTTTMFQTGQSSGAVATAGTAVTVVITFPTPYKKVPTSVLVAVAGSSGGNAGYVVAYADPASWTNTGFTVTLNAYVAGTVKFTWVSIGQ